MPSGRPWTTHEEARLRVLVREGMPANRVGEIMGRTPHAIYQRAQAMGIKFHGYKTTHLRKVTDAQIAWARKALKSGISRDEIQSGLGISRNYLNMILRGERR